MIKENKKRRMKLEKNEIILIRRTRLQEYKNTSKASIELGWFINASKTKAHAYIAWLDP